MTTMTGDEPYEFDWHRLVPPFVHPVRVAIIEAMTWIGEPISSSELVEVFERRYVLSLVSYHVRVLTQAGLLEETSHRQVRGSRQTFYFFTDAGK